MSARRRRNQAVVYAQQQQQQQQPSASPSQQQQQQQRRKAAGAQERPAGSQLSSRSKAPPAASKQSKPWINSTSIAVVPPSRQANNNNTNNNKINARAKKHTRCTSAREMQRDVQRPPVTPQPATSRVACGRSCAGATSTITMTQTTMTTLTRRGGGGKQRCRQDTPRPKPMQAAHDQLELLLTRIEQDTVAPPPRRRKPAPAKTVRRQMEHPPPVPTVTPMGSARTPRPGECGAHESSFYLNAAGGHAAAIDGVVPLTQNPRMLAPGKRQALLELLSRSEPQDQEIVNALRSEISLAGDPSTDAMRLTLQML